MAAPRPGKLKRTLLTVLLFVPFFLAIAVPVYNRLDPSLFGVPFFYWFQFALIIVTAIITALVYKARL